MDFYEVLEKRRTYRDFSDREVSNEDYSFNVSRFVQFEGHIFLFASGKGSASHKYC